MDRRQFSAFSLATRELPRTPHGLRGSRPTGRLAIGAMVIIAVLVTACTPALNWRHVQVQELRAQLPCKPDHATRNVSLAGESVSLEMAGCAADGALFAVSRVEASDAAAAARVMAAWQTQALAALKATDTRPANMQVPRWVSAHTALQASGKNAQGQPTQARLTWLQREARVYHLAVYAEPLTDAMTQPFLEDLQIP